MAWGCQQLGNGSIVSGLVPIRLDPPLFPTSHSIVTCARDDRLGISSILAGQQQPNDIIIIIIYWGLGRPAGKKKRRMFYCVVPHGLA